MSASRRIESLDGLRAVSILLVLIAHLQITHGILDHAPAALRLVVTNGDLGVTVFFVISGFLITTLLTRELEARDTISIRDFYLRRTFRIFPALYVYLGALVIAAHFGFITLKPRAWIASSLFVRNYAAPVEHVSDWYTAHFWSLSVEEQFYLFWPLTLAFLKPRRAIGCAAGLILAAPLLRVATYVTLPDMRSELNYLGHTRVDSLM